MTPLEKQNILEAVALGRMDPFEAFQRIWEQSKPFYRPQLEKCWVVSQAGNA